MRPLQTRFIYQALRHPSRIAVIDTNSQKNYTYRQILIASLIFKKKISALTQKERVGLMVPPSAGCIISKLAILMSKKTPVMINYSAGVKDNCELAVSKCDLDLILTSKALLQKLNLPQTKEMICLEDLLTGVTVFDKILGLLKSFFPLKAILTPSNHDAHAVILFTSGSEKEPKIVPLTHKNIASNYESIRRAISITHEDVFMAVLPFFHVFGMTTSLWAPLLAGGAIVTHANPLDFKAIVDSIKKNKPTCLFSTPAFFQGYFLKAQKGDFDSLKLLIAGGDKLSKEIHCAYLKTHEKEIYEGYGATELSPVVSVNLERKNRLGSIGTPLDNVEVKICDIEEDRELPKNTEGRLLVKGPSVMNGYLGNQEATDAVFKNGWYDTGDIAYIDDDGFIFHCGRLRRFVKIGGEMASMIKIEEEIQPLVSDEVQICVVPRHHQMKGSELVVAYCGSIDEELIRQELSKKLPPLFIPKVFTKLKEIPLLGTGKVNFKEVEKIINSST